MLTLYLTNWSSRGQHGPGRLISAMAHTPEDARAASWGVFLAAQPRPDDLRFVLASKRKYLARDLPETQFRADETWYRGQCANLFGWRQKEGLYHPDQLQIEFWPDRYLDAVRFDALRLQDGDTLCCTCARPGSPRRLHHCHLETLAPFLAGPDVAVVLYGQPLGAAPVPPRQQALL